jgi:hypothetical protein
MRVGPASLTFVHPYPEIRESNLTSPSFTPSNQTKSQVESGHYERSLSFKGERGNARPSLKAPRGNLNQHRELRPSTDPNLAVRSIENRVQSCTLNFPQPPFPTTNTSIPLPHHSKRTFKNKAEGQEEEVRELGVLILINEVRVPYITPITRAIRSLPYVLFIAPQKFHCGPLY